MCDAVVQQAASVPGGKEGRGFFVKHGGYSVRGSEVKTPSVDTRRWKASEQCCGHTPSTGSRDDVRVATRLHLRLLQCSASEVLAPAPSPRPEPSQPRPRPINPTARPVRACTAGPGVRSQVVRRCPALLPECRRRAQGQTPGPLPHPAHRVPHASTEHVCDCGSSGLVML